MTRPKRSYTLGKREVSINDTRRRIVEAAAEVYREQGIRATSMQKVARRADVAPATALKHFPDTDHLVRAVVEHLHQRNHVPTADMLEGVDGLSERLKVLIAGVYEHYERSEPWLQMFLAEHDSVPALKDAAVQVNATIRGLVMTALGTLSDNPEVRMTVGAALSFHFRAALISNGATSTQACELAFRWVTLWLEHHQASQRVDGQVSPVPTPSQASPF